MTNRSITVIVPTYNDWERLSYCVQALSAQTYPATEFDVIIVDNNPEDRVPESFYLPANFKIITEVKPGSYAARNAALKIATGEIIGFTDSDCIPDKDWIRNAVDHFNQNESCTRIAGNIVLFTKTLKPTTAEYYERLYYFKQKEYVHKHGTGATANLFVYKYVFEKAGLFNDNLMSSGDFNWGIMAHKAGYRIDYVENVIVKHPARTLSELIKKQKRVTGGKVQRRQGKQPKLSVFLRFLKDARPRVRGDYKYIKENGPFLTPMRRLMVLLLRMQMRYVRAHEIMRLQLGKKPNRI